MEPVVPGGAQPLAGILTVADDYDGVFKNIYDSPYITVNRVGDEIHAEVFRSDVDEITHGRLMTAHAVARSKGFQSYARVFADLYEDDNVVNLKFTDDPAKGVIWALESKPGNAWLQ